MLTTVYAHRRNLSVKQLEWYHGQAISKSLAVWFHLLASVALDFAEIYLLWKCKKYESALGTVWQLNELLIRFGSLVLTESRQPFTILLYDITEATGG